MVMTTAKIIRTTTIAMDAEETDWLKKRVQNGQEGDTDHDADMRKRFWDALCKVDKLEHA